jgi:SOS-response transcriptional repressor LexA
VTRSGVSKAVDFQDAGDILLLVVNQALEPKDGSVVVAVLDGELTIKGPVSPPGE